MEVRRPVGNSVGEVAWTSMVAGEYGDEGRLYCYLGQDINKSK